MKKVTSIERLRPFRYRVTLVAVLAVYLIFMCLAWYGGFYIEAAKHLGVPAFDSLFLDILGPLSWLECARQEIDIFTVNPCDPLDRVYNYGHAWLLLVDTGLSTADTAWLGAVLSVSFLIGVAAVLRPVNLDQTIYCSIVVIAPAVMFAAERANLDILIFILFLTASGFLSQNLAGRIIGYSVIFGCGLLKFYPFVALILALRERTKISLCVFGFSVLGVTAYVVLFGTEIRSIFGNMPWTFHPIEFTSRGIAKAMSSLLNHALDLDLNRRGLWYDIVRPLLPLIGLWLSYRAFKWLRRSDLRIETTQIETVLFLLGISVVAFCFFVGRNFSYRAIFLILCLPALLSLADDLAARGDRSKVRMVWAALVLLGVALWWSALFYNLQLIEEAIGAIAYDILWILSEVMNWALVVLLSGFALQLLSETPAIKSRFARSRRGNSAAL